MGIVCGLHLVPVVGGRWSRVRRLIVQPAHLMATIYSNLQTTSVRVNCLKLELVYAVYI